MSLETQPRCRGKGCYKKDGCKNYTKPSTGWVEQYPPFRCKKFVPIDDYTGRAKAA